MKKISIRVAALFMASMILSGCSLLDKANGILLYGDEEKVLESLKQKHKGQIEKEYLPIKMMENGGKRLMVFDEETAQQLIGMELLREVVDGRDTEAVSSLPELSEGRGLLLAKNADNETQLEAMEIETKYEGNIIIGDGRTYADMFLIVTAEDFIELETSEKTIGIIKYNKDPDGIGEFDVEREQLVKIGE